MSAFTGRPNPEATISLFSSPLNTDGWETSRGSFRRIRVRGRGGESFEKVGVGKHKFQRKFVRHVVRITSCAQFVFWAVSSESYNELHFHPRKAYVETFSARLIAYDASRDSRWKTVTRSVCSVTVRRASPGAPVSSVVSTSGEMQAFCRGLQRLQRRALENISNWT